MMQEHLLLELGFHCKVLNDTQRRWKLNREFGQGTTMLFPVAEAGYNWGMTLENRTLAECKDTEWQRYVQIDRAHQSKLSGSSLRYKKKVRSFNARIPIMS